MQRAVVVWTIFAAIHSGFVSPVEISSKLDFSDTNTKSKLVRSDQLGAPKLEVSGSVKEDEGFESIGIVCSLGSCNKTKSDSASNTNKDTLKADVVVHIETKINREDKNTSTTPEDIPDIPVVIGYEGADIDTSYGAGAGAGSTFDNSDGNNGQNPALAPETNIQKLTPKSLFRPSGFNGVRSKENGIEVQIPYFEPSYNSHYYGETPAPQFLWYPRTANYNPVEFKNTMNRRTWSSGTPQRSYHSFRTDEGGCICHNSRSQRGPSWHTKPVVQQPGSQINDKLAPLN